VPILGEWTEERKGKERFLSGGVGFSTSFIKAGDRKSGGGKKPINTSICKEKAPKRGKGVKSKPKKSYRGM